MSENDKPIFPRGDERDEEEDERIFNEAKTRLDAVYQEERFCYRCSSIVPSGVKFCLNCGVLVSENTQSKSGGAFDYDSIEETSSPFKLTQSEIDKIPVMPMYGPPPMPIGEKKYVFWLILIGFFLLIGIIAIVLSQIHG